MNITKEIVKIARKDIDKALALCEHLRAFTDAPGPLAFAAEPSLDIELDNVTTNAELGDLAQMAQPTHKVGDVVCVRNRAVAETLVGCRVVWGWFDHSPGSDRFDNVENVILEASEKGVLLDEGYWTTHAIRYLDFEGDSLYMRVVGLPDGS